MSMHSKKVKANLHSRRFYIIQHLMCGLEIKLKLPKLQRIIKNREINLTKFLNKRTRDK